MDLSEFQKQITSAIFGEIQRRAEKIGIAGDGQVPPEIMDVVLSEAQTAVLSVYLLFGGDLSEFAASIVRACIERPSADPEADPESNPEAG